MLAKATRLITVHPEDLSNLFDGLQREQFEHDEKFHREIVRLDTHRRLAHIALHLGKYLCHLQMEWDRVEAREKALIDTLIMCLSGLNLLNQRLSELWKNEVGSLQVDALADWAGYSREKENFLKSFSGSVLFAMESAEKLDHVEEYPFRTKFVGACSKLAALAYCELGPNAGLSVEQRVRARLLGVKKKSIFFES